VREWLRVAAGVDGFIGFAVGRTDLWEPLVNLRENRLSREAAVAAIAGRYREFADTFEAAGASHPTSHLAHDQIHNSPN
jgi:5-dehydro-2-deoxygluconokinase